MKSIALDWPDESFPANAVVSGRQSVDEAAVFIGFGDDARGQAPRHFERRDRA